MKDDLSTIANFAVRMAREGGVVAMRGFRRGAEVENKSDDTAVTAADREGEAHMRGMIARTYPQSRRCGGGVWGGG